MRHMLSAVLLAAVIAGCGSSSGAPDPQDTTASDADTETRWVEDAGDAEPPTDASLPSDAADAPAAPDTMGREGTQDAGRAPDAATDMTGSDVPSLPDAAADAPGPDVVGPDAGDAAPELPPFPDSDGDGIPDSEDFEECDGIDNDGDGVADNGLDFHDYYPDPDGDGYYGLVPADVQPSCAALLEAGKTEDGIYLVDPDGEGGIDPLSVACDMTRDGGGWTRVFYHDIAGGYWAGSSDALERSKDDPTALRYSILSSLEAFRSPDGTLEMRIDWPDTACAGRNIWRQTSNPANAPVAGYQPVSVDYTDFSWGGLELNSFNASSFIDGSVGIAWWFYAVGSTVAWADPPGIPACSMTAAARVELWVRPHDPVTGKLPPAVPACGPGSSLSDVPGDCAPEDPLVFASAPELCDAKDNDCDGEVDEECPSGSLEMTLAPLPLQFYPRTSGAGTCTFHVEGNTLGAATEARVRLLQDGKPFTATQSAAGPAFSIPVVVDAGLHLYDVIVEWDNGSGWWKPVTTYDSVVCGDVFLIDGQSNAVASDYHEEHLADKDTSTFVRSFGSSLNAAAAASDVSFGIAVAEANYTHAAVGQWGLRLAMTVMQEEQMPILLINGAVGGTKVEQHQRNDLNPEDLSTIYGRLLWRVHKAGVADSVRAIFWHQGESDGGMGYATYLGLWIAMYADWLQDYPNVEAVYPFQVRAGCGDPTWNRNVHRDLPTILPKVLSHMSTTGVSGHDGCHFYHQTYVEWGERMARLARRDLYAAQVPGNIEAPDPVAAHWLDDTHLAIDYGPTGGSLVLQPGAEAYFSLSAGKVTGAAVDGSTVVLTTTNAGGAAWVSLVDTPGDIPWLVNDLGIGSFVYYQLPITQ